MKVKYHKFTGDIPIIFVDKIENFISTHVHEAKHAKVNPASYFNIVDAGDMTCLVFSENILNEKFKDTKDVVIDTALALYVGMKKHPANPKLLFRTAYTTAMRYECVEAGKAIKLEYAKLYNEDLDADVNPIYKNDLALHETILFEDYDNRVKHIDVENWKTHSLLTEKAILDKVKRIIELLKSKTFPDDILARIENLVSRDEGKVKKAIDKITTFGIPAQYAEEIVEEASNYPDLDKFLNYVHRRSLTLSDLKSAGTIFKGLEKTKLNPEFLKWLINYQWPSSPNIGAGEAALICLLKDGNKPGKGDVGIGNQEIEVKGDNGRIKGQKGYGLGASAARVFEEESKKLMEKIPKKDRIPIPKMGGLEYNVNKTGKKGWAMNDLGAHFVTHKVATKATIAKIWKQAIMAIYLNMSSSDLKFVDKYVQSDGTIKDYLGFVEAWMIASLQYYAKLEGFSAIIFMSRSGKIGVLEKKDFKNPLSVVKITGVVNFSQAAGPQGGAFGISIK